MMMSYVTAPQQVVMQAPPVQTVQYVQSAPQMVMQSAPSVQYIQQPVNYVQQVASPLSSLSVTPIVTGINC